MTATETVAGTGAPAALDEKRIGRIVVGVVCLLLSIGYLVEAMSMPFGRAESPGPGTFPTGVGFLAIGVSIIVIIEGLTGSGTRGSLDLPTGTRLRSVLVFSGTLVAFVVVLPFLGQYVASSLYVIVTLKFLGGRSWMRSILMGALVGIGVTAVFSIGLGVQLPSLRL